MFLECCKLRIASVFYYCNYYVLFIILNINGMFLPGGNLFFFNIVFFLEMQEMSLCGIKFVSKCGN
jgi:hypothetical protein